MNINIQSITNKTNALALLAIDEKIDIICVTENWLNENNQSMYNLVGFKNVTTSVRNVYKQGGVSIYTKVDIKTTEMPSIQALSTDKDCELAAVFFPDMNLVSLVSYRSPTGNLNIFFDTLETALTKIDKDYPANTKIVIAGDFNINFIEDSKHLRELQKIMENYGFTPTIYEPTHITENQRKCIDNILINFANYSCAEVLQTQISDHKPQIIRFSLTKKTQTATQKRCYSESNYNNFIQQITKEAWENVYNCSSDANEMFNQFFDTFKYYFDLSFPIKTNSIKRNDMNLSPELRNALNSLKAMSRFQVEYGNEESLEVLKRCKKAYIETAEKAHKQSNLDRILESTNKSKTVWQIVNWETGRNKITEHKKPHCEEFNIYYTSIAEKLLDGLNTNSATQNTASKIETEANSIFLWPATPEEITKYIKDLKSKNTEDIYGISTKTLKAVGHIIAPHLCNIINVCLDKGIFPAKLKVAKVIPIYKKGDKNNCSNYRPISILPSLSKIFEQVMISRIIKFMENNNYLTSCQFGYRPQKGTADALDSLLRYVYNALENHKRCTSTLCDLSKAFDVMSPQLFLNKMEHYGCRGKALDLVTSYFNNRYQAVAVNGHISKLRRITHGIPQGSIAGPIFFIIFMNDLPLHIKHHLIMYADDTTITVEHMDNEILEINMAAELQRASDWFKANLLIQNEEKTCAIQYKMDRWEDTDESVKLLGVTIDSRLTWKDHIDQVSLRVAKSAYAIRRVSKVSGEKAAIITYHALCASILNYCIEIWGHSSHLKTLFVEQKKAVRGIRWLSNSTSCKPLFQEFQILTLPCMYILRILTTIHKNRDELIRNGNSHNYHTRQRNHVIIPKNRLKTTEYLRSAIKLYNKCQLWWNCNDIQFKSNLKKHLLGKAYYTLEEFKIVN